MIPTFTVDSRKGDLEEDIGSVTLLRTDGASAPIPMTRNDNGSVMGLASGINDPTVRFVYQEVALRDSITIQLNNGAVFTIKANDNRANLIKALKFCRPERNTEDAEALIVL